MGFGIGRSKFRLDVSASVRDKWISVNLTLRGSDAKSHFNVLKQDRIDIETAIGAELEWEEKPEQKRSYISRSLEDTDLEDRQDRDRQHQWLCGQLETFHKVFSPRVKELDARDYIPDENEAIE